ncbi:MAG: UDP-N-acetylmuramate:L-alanyl-gamma-D-glutamyl-meso-diaminopimelate ligase [Gammaproteobacteria bacterium]|nr:UDP-N-acetylmuramate:L-alanyl-gamma-D-glutamyl-meso-diaminopimelate ligase [Gammaproteobacteria bacterium]
MHIHILGICGTFMGGIAVLARQAGHKVSGSDQNVYPPMSTQLQEQGIELIQGYEPEQLQQQDDRSEPDQVVVGNAMSRGKPVVEYVLNRNLSYTSGPQWLYENVLKERWVLAVAGTHGKTTTASMLAWILEYAGLKPGFLIGGIPANFGLSARLGESPFFVVEADEYDTAFFDKRSKFVHYHSRTLILNNLEFDHADIFEDLDAIKKQFHHLIRTVPGEGLIISNADESNLDDVLQQGCWTKTEMFSVMKPNGWSTRLVDEAGQRFEVLLDGATQGVVSWSMIGAHNRSNALAAIAAARHAGVPVDVAIAALAEFKGVKRRQEVIAQINGITVYDDFAHHPTAIEETLQGLRQRVAGQRIIAILEPRSNTMRMGVHKAKLAASLAEADQVFLFQPADMDWALDEVIDELGNKARLFNAVGAMIDELMAIMNSGDHIMIMSNGGFEGLHQRLKTAMDA